MLRIIALTCEAAGSILVAWVALSVHHRVLREHQIDDAVYRFMRKEQKLGGVGIFLILTGYFLQIFFLE